MAEYIRFRWTRTKAGVTMAFLALLGGLAEESSSSAATHGKPVATASSWSPKLSLRGIGGNLRTSLVKIDKSISSLYYKEQKAISSLYYKEQKATSSAINKVYAKVTTNFLSQSDAGKLYLKANGTAANSELLGNLAPSAFFHGNGGISTGLATFTGGVTPVPLLKASDGSIIVVCDVEPGGGPTVTITNNTSNAYNWIATINGNAPTAGTLAPGASANLNLLGGNNIGQATVQLVPVVQTGSASTLTVSTEPGSGGSQTFIGQMLIGLL